MKNITIKKTIGKLPLFKKHPQQNNHQPAYLYLTEKGEVSMDYSSDIGESIPHDVWCTRQLRWNVTPFLTVTECNSILSNDNVINMLNIIYNGHEIVWNGNNHVGCLTESAQTASDTLQSFLDNLEPTIEVWNCADYFQDNSISELIEPGETTEQAAERLEAEIAANNDNVFLSDNLAKYLNNRIN